MKLKECFEDYEDYEERWCPVPIQHIINKYYDEDVVLFEKCQIGKVIIFKGVKKYFSLVILDRNVWFGGFDYKITRIEPETAVKLLNIKGERFEDDD